VCVCVCERPSLITICPCIANIRWWCVCKRADCMREGMREKESRTERVCVCVCITHPCFSSQDEEKT